MIQKWQKKLGLETWKITTEAISDEQVIYPSDCLSEERFFVGIDICDGEATIYHARELTEEDIVHELLHIKHPRRLGETHEEYEDWIEHETKTLMRPG